MDKAILSFGGVEGYDVYNTSIPFEYEGETYLFGRVEKRTEWATSHVRLFRKTGKDQYAAVADSMIYPLEDPCIARIGGEYVLCGTHVRKRMGSVYTYYAWTAAMPVSQMYPIESPLATSSILHGSTQGAIGWMR